MSFRRFMLSDLQIGEMDFFPAGTTETMFGDLPLASFTVSGHWDSGPPDPGEGLTWTIEQGAYEVTGSVTFAQWRAEALRPELSAYTRRAVRRGEAVVGRIVGSDRCVVLHGYLAVPFHRRHARFSRMRSMYRRRNR